MPSLWTDNDTGEHPWLAAPPHPGPAGPPPPAAPTRQDDDVPRAARFARPVVLAAAGTTAGLAGAAIELLR